MEAIALAILKTIATTCVKLYVQSLWGGSTRLVYDQAELGYKVPKWYLEQPSDNTTFYSFGTSVKGDEFESIEDATQRAREQMGNHIRLSNQKIVESLHYDAQSVKQKRLVEMFLRADGLEDYLRVTAKVDKQQLVKVPSGDMRAFIRLALPSSEYISFQEKWVHDLKDKLIHQKDEDITAELEQEVQNYEHSAEQPPPEHSVTPAPTETQAPSTTPSTHGNANDAFNELNGDKPAK